MNEQKKKKKAEHVRARRGARRNMAQQSFLGVLVNICILFVVMYFVFVIYFCYFFKRNTSNVCFLFLI